MYTPTLLATLALAALVSAKTDLEGCTSSKTIAFGGASMIYWVPDTGEICSFLDCGGGRAPPKTTVPGCGHYEGTATYTPDYMPGFGADATPTPTGENVSSEEGPAPTESAGLDVTSSTSKAVLTAAPSLSSGAVFTMSVGTVSPTAKGNGTATFSSASPTLPMGTGAANALSGKGQGVLGLAGVVAGLALL